MTVAQDILKPEPPAFIELFEIDLTLTKEVALDGSIFRITPMTDSSDLANIHPIMWGGDVYTPFPIQLTGLSVSSDGAPARPHLAVANVSKEMGNLVFQFRDLVGASVTYIRTFQPYLGTSQKISLPPVKFFIAKKMSHNKMGITFELRDYRDKERAFMPNRQMLRHDFPGLGINKQVK